MENKPPPRRGTVLLGADILPKNVDAQNFGNSEIEPPRKHGEKQIEGWGNNSVKLKPVISAANDEAKEEQQNVSDEDIPTIPDLEDHQDEPFQELIAQPPVVKTTRVATIRELDADLLMSTAYNINETEFDLSLLSRALLPSFKLQE
eukprot:Sdes_comp14158_c0_seq1m3400